MLLKDIFQTFASWLVHSVCENFLTTTLFSQLSCLIWVPTHHNTCPDLFYSHRYSHSHSHSTVCWWFLAHVGTRAYKYYSISYFCQVLQHISNASMVVLLWVGIDIKSEMVCDGTGWYNIESSVSQEQYQYSFSPSIYSHSPFVSINSPTLLFILSNWHIRTLKFSFLHVNTHSHLHV